MPALSTIARREYYTELGTSLPPPVIDKPEYRERRLITAIEAFEALRPGDAYEARLAVQIVLTGAHAAEGLRAAGVYREDFAKSSRCHAQAASMMRQERATKRVLAQEQKVRLATEAVANGPKAQPAAASAPLSQTVPQAAPPPVQPAATAPRPAPVAAPVSAGAPPRPAAAQAASPAAAATQTATPPAPPSPDSIAQAEAFAEEDIAAAAQIRHDRGVTPQNKARFHYLMLPTDPAVIDALVHGTSDVLTLLDEVSGENLDEAA